MKGPTPLGPVKTLPIGQVRPSPDNPRKIGQSAIDIVAKSIAKFGWQQPLVVDVDHVVIVGHTRLLAAKKLQLKTVPVVVAEGLTPDQVRAYRIADNRSGDFTTWDFTALTGQLEDLAPDFSDVLALADWQAIVGEYDAQVAAVADPTPRAVGAPGAPATGPATGGQERSVDDRVVDYLSKDFQLTVVCDSEQAARVIAAQVIDMPGVIDVRDKR